MHEFELKGSAQRLINSCERSEKSELARHSAIIDYELGEIGFMKLAAREAFAFVNGARYNWALSDFRFVASLAGMTDVHVNPLKTAERVMSVVENRRK